MDCAVGLLSPGHPLPRTVLNSRLGLDQIFLQFVTVAEVSIYASVDPSETHDKLKCVGHQGGITTRELRDGAPYFCSTDPRSYTFDLAPGEHATRDINVRP